MLSNVVGNAFIVLTIFSYRVCDINF